jgi:DNA polymerase-4
MRSYGVMCGTVAVSVRDTNLNTVSRQRKLRNPTYLCKDIASVSVDIIRELTDISKPIRSLTVTGMDICKADTVGVQQSFFTDESTRREKNEKLETAIDRIRARFGGEAVTRASSVNSGLGI